MRPDKASGIRRYSIDWLLAKCFDTVCPALALWVVFVAFCVLPAHSQGYLTSTGEPGSAVPQPVEMGNVDAVSGNLHLSIPLGTFPQRGSSSFTLRLDYDSHIWSAQNNGVNMAWYPAYFPGFMANGGWRVVAPSTWETPSLLEPASRVTSSCSFDWVLIEPNGTQHWFNIYDTLAGGCNYVATASAWATDSSGIKMTEFVPSDKSTAQITAYAPDGTLLLQDTMPTSGHGAGTSNPNTPQDPNGNHWAMVGPSGAFQGVGQDTVGRTPLQTPTTSGCTFTSVTGASYYRCYDVATSQGTSRYTITFTDISLKTSFGQSGISECTTNCVTTVISRIDLPDNTSSYNFKYDCDSTGNAACSSPGAQTTYYGALTRMTLPTGETISYGYSNFKDYNGAVSRWLTSKSSSKGTWSYSPKGTNGIGISTPCAPFGVTVSCLQTTVSRPDRSVEIVGWINDVVGGAWPYQVRDYDSDGTTLLSTTNNSWDFSQPCKLIVACNGSGFQNVHLLKTTVIVPVPGGNLTKQTTYAYDAPTDANITALKEWKYQSGTSPTFPSVPDRATYTTYATFVNNNINRPLSITVCNNSGSDTNCPGGGTTAARTVIAYDAYGANGSLALQPASGFVNHDDANFGTAYMPRGNATRISQYASGNTYLSNALSYDVTGQVVQSSDAAGNNTVYSYNDNFYQDNGADPPTPFSAPLPTHAYLTQITDALGSVSAGYYFNSGKTAVSTDYNLVSTYAHFMDPFDRPTQTDFPSGWTLKHYTSVNQLDAYSAVADATASQACTSCVHTQANFDSLGRVTSEYLINNPAGQVVSTTTYDGLNRAISSSHSNFGSSDPNNVKESFLYDGLGRGISSTHPDSQSARSAFGAKVGTLGGLTSQLGSTTSYGLGFPVVLVDEAGKQRQEWIDGFGRVIEVDEPNTNSSTAGSKSFSLVINTPLSITYDPCEPIGAGSCAYEVDNTGTVTITVNGFSAGANYYPGIDATTLAVQLASALSGAGSPVTASSSGSTVTMRAVAAGALTNYSYSSSVTYNQTMCGNSPCFSGPGASVSPSSGSLAGGAGGLSPTTSWATNYTYDVLGNLVGVNQGSQVRSYQYDGLSRITYSRTPEASLTQTGPTTYYPTTISYANSSGGLCSGDPSNPCTKTDGRGIVTTYSYDAANRLISKTHTGNTGSEIYGYGTSASAFNIGRLVSMADPSGSESYTYDRAGRITQLTKTVSGVAYVIRYGYNTAGQLTSLTYPSGRVVNYSYDNVGHTCVVAGSASSCTSYSSPYLTISSLDYDPSSRPTKFTYGNGVVGTATYSPQTFQLTGLTYAKGSTTLFGLNYYYQKDPLNCPIGSAYGNNGQVQCISDTVQPGRSARYTYDMLGRLLTANTSGSAAYPAWGLSETYDRYGNRANQTVTAGSGYSSSLTINAFSNQVSGYTYDQSGNVTAQPAPVGATFAYDGENCLTNYSGVSNTAAYTCDGGNVRVKKIVTGSNPVTTVYIRSGGDVIAEYDNGAAVNSPTREYIVSEKRIATVLGSVGGVGGTITYEHRDHLSPRFFTDANGSCVGDQGTYPFGEAWYANNDPNCSTTASSAWIFTSYERDQESGLGNGLDYALARSYGGGIGRFMSPDPLDGSVGDPQSWNRYAYVENDPINLSDPSGLGFLSDLLDFFEALFGFGNSGSGLPVFGQPCPESGPPGSTCVSTSIDLAGTAAAVCAAGVCYIGSGGGENAGPGSGNGPGGASDTSSTGGNPGGSADPASQAPTGGGIAGTNPKPSPGPSSSPGSSPSPGGGQTGGGAPKVSVSTVVYLKVAEHVSEVGVQVLVMATVNGGHNAAYNWQQTVVTNFLDPGNNNAPPGSKANKPFNDSRGNASGLYWSPDEQKTYMERAAKHGGSTMFMDTPGLRISAVPRAGWTFNATLSLVKVNPTGPPTVLWTGTWGFTADRMGKITPCMTCDIHP